MVTEPRVTTTPPPEARRTITSILLGALAAHPGKTATELAALDSAFHGKAISAWLSGLSERGVVRSDTDRPKHWWLVAEAPAVPEVVIEGDAEAAGVGSDLAEPDPVVRPSGEPTLTVMEQVLALLRDNPARGWTSSDLRQELESRVELDRPVRHHLERLRTEGRVRSEGLGAGLRWYFREARAAAVHTTVQRRGTVALGHDAMAADVRMVASVERPTTMSPSAPTPDHPAHATSGLQDSAVPAWDNGLPAAKAEHGRAPAGETHRAEAEGRGAGVVAVRERVLDAVSWVRGEMQLNADADPAFVAVVLELLGLADGDGHALRYDSSGLLDSAGHTAFLVVNHGRISIVFLSAESFSLFLSTFHPRS